MTGEVKTEDKTVIAAKAKKKFLDNLSKFQKDNKQSFTTKNSSAFQRSYRMPQEKPSSALRRSCRAPSSQTSKEQSHHLRQSLREKSLSSRSEKTASRREIRGEKVNELATRKTMARNDPTGTHTNDKSTDLGKISEATNSVESMTSSHRSLPSDQVSTPRPSSQQRSLSRAEAAMERHKERMRKGSQQHGILQNSTPLPISNQTTSKTKKRTRRSDVTSQDKSSVNENMNDCESQPHITIKEPSMKPLVDESSVMSRDDKAEESDGNTVISQTRRTSTPSWDRINVVEDCNLFDSTLLAKPTEEIVQSEYQNGFDLLDIRSPMIKRKNHPNRGNLKRNRANRLTGNRNALTSKSMQEGNLSAKKDLKPKKQSVNKTTASDSISNILEEEKSIKSATIPQIHLEEDEEKVKVSGQLRETNLLSIEEFQNAQTNEKKQGFQLKMSSECNFEQNHNIHLSPLNVTPFAQPELRDLLPEELIIMQDSETPLAVVASNRQSTAAEEGIPRPVGSASKKRETREARDERQRNGKEKSPMHNAEEKRDVIGKCDSRDDDVALASPAREKSWGQKPTTNEQLNINSFASEKIVLTLPEKHKSRQLKGEIQRNQAMSGEADRDPVTKGKFRLLSAAQRREKLRQVLLKYRKETADDSPFSDISDDDDSDIDMEWLEKGDVDMSFDVEEWLNGSNKLTVKAANKHSVHNQVTITQKGEPHSPKERPITSPKSPKIVAERATIERSSTAESQRQTMETSDKQRRLSEVKTAWENKSNGEPAEEPSPILENGSKDDASDEEAETPEPRKVGSMLSMWENRQAKKHSAFNATKDEAFDSSTVGRLKGAKALFQNMSKSSNNSSVRLGRHNSSCDEVTSLKTSTASIFNVKDVFEKKSGMNNVRRSASMKVQSRPFSVDPTPSTVSPPSTTISESVVKKSSVDPIAPPKPPRRSSANSLGKSRGFSTESWLEDIESDGDLLSSATTSEDEGEAFNKTRNEQKLNGNSGLDQMQNQALKVSMV